MGFLLGASPAALAAPVDDYIVMKAAEKINLACGGLKYFEHERTLSAAADYLSRTPQDAQVRDGRLTEPQYDAWLAEQTAKVDAAVAAAGCTQAAYAYLLPAKARAAEEIYRDLVLAFHFAQMPEGSLDRLKIDNQQVQASQGFETYLRQLYGEGFDAFAARQREIASSELPAANPFGQGGFGLGTTLGMMITDPNAMMKNSSLRMEGGDALRKVHFEVAAEAGGLLVRPLPVADRTLAQLVHPASAEPPLTIVDGPNYLLFDPDPDNDTQADRIELSTVAGLSPDGRLRILFFGDAALAHLTNPTVRLYVRTEPLPSAVSSWEMFDREDWRQGTTMFEGVRSSAACLGAPCFDFPAKATEALIAFTQGDYAELFVSSRPNDDRDFFQARYRPGKFSNYYTWLVSKGAGS
ncbi:MAG: hypothetical protein ACO1OK_13345 [Devosia sp.]